MQCNLTSVKKKIYIYIYIYLYVLETQHCAMNEKVADINYYKQTSKHLLANLMNDSLTIFQ